VSVRVRIHNIIKILAIKPVKLWAHLASYGQNHSPLLRRLTTTRRPDQQITPTELETSVDITRKCGFRNQSNYFLLAAEM
jgi:hypothetical protein